MRNRRLHIWKGSVICWNGCRAELQKTTFLPGDPTGDVCALRQEDPLWEDGPEVPGLPCGGPSRMQAEMHQRLLSFQHAGQTSGAALFGNKEALLYYTDTNRNRDNIQYKYEVP